LNEGAGGVMSGTSVDVPADAPEPACTGATPPASMRSTEDFGMA